MSNIKKTLSEMAQLAMFSGRISEVQEQNMKVFPFVFFEGVTEVKIDYDLGYGINDDTKEINHKSFIGYELQLDESANKLHLDKRFAALEFSVRELFWKDIAIKISFNGKEVYGSKNV